MSDLISRRELLKRFFVNKDGHRIPERDCDNFEITVSIKDIKAIIKEQPTAYDVDKAFEKDGRLIKLHCNVGDTIWDNDFGYPVSYKITGFSFGSCDSYIAEPVSKEELVYYYSNPSGSITGSFAECELGKTVFHTRTEAEVKMKKLRENEKASR